MTDKRNKKNIKKEGNLPKYFDTEEGITRLVRKRVGNFGSLEGKYP